VVAEKARIDRGLIATLRESSRPLRPEASLTSPLSADGDRISAIERLETVVESLLARVAFVEARLSRLEHGSRLKAEVGGHTLFVATASGYLVVEREGPPPGPGDEVVLDGRAYRAERYRPSPFPRDRRPCAIVEGCRPVGGA
jgi:hypothetical protein